MSCMYCGSDDHSSMGCPTRDAEEYYTATKALFVLALTLVIGCNTVQVYDPPMVENRHNMVCSTTSQCQFPDICQRDRYEQLHGVCR